MADDSEVFEGGCACGGVRYAMTARPMFVHCCHCRRCQRLSGSAFALNAMVEADRVELLSGSTETILVPFEGRPGQRVTRCPDCKTAVWSTYGGREAIRFVRVGSLDEPDRFPPDIHIFTASKQPWVVLPEGATAVPEFYKQSEVWPAESIARRKAAMDRESAG